MTHQSSGAVKKVVLDMETFITNTIQVSTEIPSDSVEQTNETDPLTWRSALDLKLYKCVHPLLAQMRSMM